MGILEALTEVSGCTVEVSTTILSARLQASISETMLSRTESSLIWLVVSLFLESRILPPTDENMMLDFDITSAMVAHGTPPSSTKVTPRDKVRLVKFNGGAPIEVRCFWRFLAILRPMEPSPDHISRFTTVFFCFA